jgi:hypothetical protein
MTELAGRDCEMGDAAEEGVFAELTRASSWT